MPDRDERRLWIIDAAYMFKAQKSLGSEFQFDYKKLRDYLEQDGPRDQVYYVNSISDSPSERQKKFHNWLKSGLPSGPQFQVQLYELKKLNLQCPGCNKKIAQDVQKGVDVGIATLALTLVDRYDTLILSSGDGDLKDAMEYIRNRCNKRLELLVFRKSVSVDLQSLSNRIYWIDDFKDKVAKD